MVGWSEFTCNGTKKAEHFKNKQNSWVSRMSQRLPLGQYSKTKVAAQSYIQADIDISNAVKGKTI